MSAKSYTQVSTYEKCPQQYNFRYEEKIQVDRVKSPAAQRGTDVHHSIDQFMQGKADSIHPEVATYQPWLEGLRGDNAVPELRWCVDENWEIVDYNSPEGYIRGFIDLVYNDEDGLVVYEFKTGKMYPEHRSQMMLYSIAARIIYDTDDCTAIGVYLDLKKNDEIPYGGSYSVDKYLWSSRIDKLDNDPYYAPRPGPYCNWCDFAKSKGGPCQFGG